MAKNQTNNSTNRTTNRTTDTTQKTTNRTQQKTTNYKGGGFPKASPLGGKLPPAGG